MNIKDCYEEFNTNCEFGELEELSNGWDKVICKKCGHPTFLTPTVETIARDSPDPEYGK